MKLLVYSHFFVPSVGGVETFVLGLARGLTTFRETVSARNVDVTVVTQTPVQSGDSDSFPFRVIRQPGLKHLFGLIRDSDIVHIAGPAIAPLLLGLLARKRLVVEHHGFQTICPNGQLVIEPSFVPCPGHFMAGNHRKCCACHTGRRFAAYKLWALTFVRRFLCSIVSANVAPTRWLATLLKLPHTVVIPHGLDPEKTAARISEPLDHSVVVFQGRLVNTKGARLLLDAVKVLQRQGINLTLVVVGDGPERDALKKLALELTLSENVQFTGRLSSSQLNAIFSETSVVVVPSIGGEVFGLVVAENMLRGLPVLASDIGAFAEVLDTAGLTFQVGSVSDLAAKLASLLQDKNLRTRLGLAARKRILDVFSERRMLKNHMRLYRVLVPTK
jgi:glycogen(starch) synthase